MNDRKNVLGMYAGQNKTVKLWLFILNGLKKRPTVLIACVNDFGSCCRSLRRFILSKTNIQQCIIH